MSHNTDTLAYPIIEFLNDQIKNYEIRKDYWEENHQQHMADYFRKVAVNRIAAFKEVLEFITENFNDNDE